MAEANVKDEIETLQSDFSQLRADIQTLTKTIGDISRRRAEEGVVNLKDVGNRTAERVRAAAASASSMKDAGLAAAERQVVEHPVTSLLVAFAAGLMLGKLVERR
jgi:ElaB/YqjD/DUF883 family membrane-anchored ribosome-binding protein